MNAAELAHALGGRANGSGFVARCPAHEDSTPSLSISETEGRVLVHCHAGCEQRAVIDELRARHLWAEQPREDRSRARLVASYDYRDADGALAYQVVRLDPKSFRQRRPAEGGGWTWNVKGVAPIPYRLPELLTAVKGGYAIYVAEGEKDVDRLRTAGIDATCNSGGAGKWRASFAEYFAGANVVIVPDNDEPGRAHAEHIAASLAPVAKSVRVLTLPGLPEHGDVSDFLDSHTVEELEELAAAAPSWTRAAKQDDAPEPAAATDLASLTLPSFADLRQMEIPTKQPIVNDLLYPGAYLFVGRPKIGKSWMLLQLVIAIGEQSPFLGFSPHERGEVLAIFGEDDDERIRSRLDTLGCAQPPATVRVVNQQRLIALARQFAASLTFPQFLDAYLEAHPGVRCVAVDTEVTARQVWNGERPKEAETIRITETDYQQTRAFDEIALRRRVAILLTNHAAKRRGETFDLHETINRSNTALAGASGSIVLADPPDADPLDPSQRMRVLAVRARDLRDEVLLAVEQRAETSWFHSLGPFIEVRQTQAEDDVLHAVEEIQGGDADEYVSAGDVAEHLGRRRETIKRTLGRMLKGGRTTWKQYRILAKRGREGGYRLERMGGNQ